MAFIIPRNQTISEALQQAFGNAAPGLIQGAQRRTAKSEADAQFLQSLAGLTGGQQDFQQQQIPVIGPQEPTGQFQQQQVQPIGPPDPSGLSQQQGFGGPPDPLGLLQQQGQIGSLPDPLGLLQQQQPTQFHQQQIPAGQQQFDRFSGITDPATRQAVLSGLIGRQFVDPLTQEKTQADIAKTRAETGQIGKADPLSPEDVALKKAQASKLLKETANIDPNTLTMDQKVKRDLIDAGIEPSAISKAETDLIKSQIVKNRAESEKLLRDAGGKLDAEGIAKQSTVLRKEFNALSKDFFESRDAFARLKASAKDPSAAGDLSLIFNFMKVLDPGSVVRESEFANAAATGSLGERWKGVGAKLLRGERVSKAVRKDFVDRATRLFKSQDVNQGKRTKRYTALSKRFGVDPAGVIDATGDRQGQETAPNRDSLLGQTSGRSESEEAEMQELLRLQGAGQ